MTLRAEGDGFIRRLAGLLHALEGEEGAAAIEQAVGLPTGILLHREHVVHGGERRFGLADPETGLGEVAPDLLGGFARFRGIGNQGQRHRGGGVVTGVIGLHARPLDRLLRDVALVFPVDGEIDFRGELRRILRGEIPQREQQARVLAILFRALFAG